MTDTKSEGGEAYTYIDDNVLSLLSIPKIAVPIITIVRTSNHTDLGFYISCKILKGNFVILEKINTSPHLHCPWFSYAYITGKMNLKFFNL
jgi:hypothetical protein